jgi:hypothetical protein
VVDADYTASSIALGLCIASVGALFVAWRKARDGARHGRWVFGGALTLLGGAGVWSVAAGVDRGVALTLLAVSLVALATIAATTPWRADRERRESLRDRGSTPDPRARRGGVGRAIAAVLVAGPLSAAAATAACLALLAVSAPFGANRAVSAFVAMPLLWAGAMLWSCIDPRLGRTAAWLSCVAAASAAVVVAAL